MSTVQELKSAIEVLPEEDYSHLRKWFAERDWELWNTEIREDSDADRLDFLIEEAFSEKADGSLRDM